MREIGKLPFTTKTPAPKVENPWGRLREVIVGRVEGAHVPQLEPAMMQVLPEHQLEFFRRHAGRPFAETLVRAASRELEYFCQVLKAFGITVHRPDAADFSQTVQGEGWTTPCGLYNAMPRDVLLGVGSKFITAPMAWRCRRDEIKSYRKILESLASRGADVIRAPRPALQDSFYAAMAPDKKPTRFPGVPYNSSILEDEPTFDAADFVPVGENIYGQISHVTNWAGVSWLRGQLGANYKLHILPVNDSYPMHIDATFVPLRPGLLLINPERLDSSRLPPRFRNWKIITAPPPEIPDSLPLYFSSKWLSMNILVIDQERVVVGPRETALIRLLKTEGFEVIEVPFDNFNAFGGGFHCATADLARDSE